MRGYGEAAWRRCFDAGMTAAEAAAALGSNRSVAFRAAKRLGYSLPDGRKSEPYRAASVARLLAPDSRAKAIAARWPGRVPLTADQWRACFDKGMTASEAAKALGRDSSSAARVAKRLGYDLPDGRRTAAARAACRERRRGKAPRQRKPTLREQLTDAERADFDLLRRKGGYRRDQALAAIGRADLIGGAR